VTTPLKCISHVKIDQLVKKASNHYKAKVIYVHIEISYREAIEIKESHILQLVELSKRYSMLGCRADLRVGH